MLPPRLALLTTFALLATPAAAVARDHVTATTTSDSATLANGRVALRLAIDGTAQVSVVSLRDQETGREWVSAPAPEFELTLNGAPTTSQTGWKLTSAAAGRLGRGGAQITLRYAPLGVSSSGVELERTWSLYPNEGALAVSAQLIDGSPAPLRIGNYTLAEVAGDPTAAASIHAFHGGSDWRQDFNTPATEPGTFDDEGQIARFDHGDGSGWFLVGQRRGGAMSRVGRESGGASWVGVESARDLFDWGPLMSSPPDYNRLANPAYPAPVRERTVAPFGAVELGQAFLGVYRGGEQQAGATFAADFADHVMPTGRSTIDINTFHPWGHGSGMSDANLRPQAALFKRLGGEVFMLDDQWQGLSSGDWNFDPTRFPATGGDATPDFVKYVHSLGLQLGLWMSPAEFNGASATFHNHPEWVCAPTGDATSQVPSDAGLGVWDFTNPSLQAYMSGVIDRLIAQDGVREFKFDFVTWLDCPPHDYLDYEDAYVAWIRQQERAHPGVTFELDETNDQRLWAVRSASLGPSWFDNSHLQGSTEPARYLHDVWASAPWIPPSSLAFGTFDNGLAAPYTPDYLVPLGLLGHLTFWTDLTPLTAAQQSETAWWLDWYRQHRAALQSVVYDDSTADPIDGTAWAAFQPWRHGHGYLFLFSQRTGGTQTVALHGLDPTRRYELTDVRSGATAGDYTGAQLTAGVPFTLAPYTAQVLSVR